MPEEKNVNAKAWVVAVSMGYGHLRAAYPLRDLSPTGQVIRANDYEDIPAKDKKVWQQSRGFYELISKAQQMPIVGNPIFSVFDYFQRISDFYPKRDLSKPTLTLKEIYRMIDAGWGRHLVEKLAKVPLPFVTTFFTTAFMAEEHKYPGDIYCVVCDTDASRSWVPRFPSETRIKYLAPTERVAERLEIYGVPSGNITITGFPLPKENIGSEKMEIAEENLEQRLLNLDPKHHYRDKHAPLNKFSMSLVGKHAPLVKKYLSKTADKANHPLTVLFSIGGAGAQQDIAVAVLESLSKKIKEEEMKLVFSVGIKKEIENHLIGRIKKIGLAARLDKNLEIICAENENDYFREFNQILNITDILWTKPSELSFYAALGLPIIIAPPLGSQEHRNEEWLFETGGGLPQLNPTYTDQWLFDLIEKGVFAEAALEGFIHGEKLGTWNIEKIIGENQK
jgi:hypothetical protein